MEEKNELNDILLQSDEEDKKDKSNLLLIAAAVLIVFFLGVIGYKILSDTSGKQKALPTQSKITAKSDDFSKMDVEKKEFKAMPKEKEVIAQDEIDAKLAKIKESFKKDLEVVKEKETQKEAPKPIALKPVEKKEAPKPVAKVVEKPAPKPVVKPVATPTTKTQKRDKFYIQVGSFQNSPSKKMLDAITSKGYSYKLRKMKNNNDGKTYTRLYVGPYSNKREAASALINAKKDIGLANAFVIRDY